MAAHAAAEVHQVDLHVVGVLVDEQADLVDVRGRAGRRVHVHHQPVLPRRREDPVKLQLTGLVVGAPAQQEAGLQRGHPLLARQRQRRGVVGVLRPRRDPKTAPDPVSAAAASRTRGLKPNEIDASGTP